VNLATVDAPTFRRKAREWFARGFVSQEAAKPEVTWTTFPEPKELRLEDTLHELRDLLLGAYVPNMQEWAPSTFHWALLKAFSQLHEVAKEPGERFWKRPVLECRFPFGWDASNPNVPRAVVGRGLEPRNLLPADGPLPLESMTEEDKDLRFQAMLFGTLFPVAPPGYRRDVGDSYAVHVPQSVKDELERLPPEEREAEGWKRLQPFTMGAREFRPRAAYPEPPTREGPLPPPVSVRGDEVDGAPLYEAASFVELGQLVVEPGEERAYFPMLVGLAMTGAKPETWPESERSSFWPALFSALEASVRGNVPNAAKVPVSPNVTTASLEPFFRSKVDLSFASSGLLSEASGLVRLPVEEDNVDEPPLLVGIAQATAEAGETVNVAVAGDALFAAKPNAHKDEGGPTELELGMGHAGAIVNAARAFGVEVPENFVFGAGQVFYKDRKLVEVRLSGFVNARLRDNGAGAGEIEASPWTTETAPTLTADEDGVLSLAPVDVGRTHLSAMVVRTSNEPIAISLLWDLRENAPPPKASTSLEDVTLAATGTVSGGGSDFPRGLALKAPTGAMVRVLRDAPTLLDRGALGLAHTIGNLKLPRKLASVPTLETLLQDEVKRLLEDEPELAFKDTRKEGLNGRAPLLRYVTTARDGKHVALTEEGRTALLERRGHLWFRRAQKDPDGITREYVVRHLPVPGGGFLEAAFTLYGMAWPLVEDARDDFEKKAKAVLAPASPQTTIPFYDAAEEKLKEELESRLQFIGAVKDAHVLMRAVMYEFGATGKSPVVMKLQDLRHLLKCELSPDGPRKVRGALKALTELRFELKASRMGSLSGKTYGSFVSEVQETKRGPGEHVEGDVAIYLSPSAFGGLRAFALPSSKVKDPKSLLLGWTKDLSKEDEETLSAEPYLKGFSKLAPYYDRHMGFTPSQTKLREWIEHEITLNKDGVRKDRAALRRKPSASDANEPREYDRAFCPLLPEDRRFYASLGHFEARKGGGAERGRKLVGTSAPASSNGKSGGRAGGLLHVMGYELPKSRVAKTKTATEALQDIRFVVEEHFGGVVVAHPSKDTWLTLAEATDALSVEELLDVAWLFFLPPDWLSKMRDRYNALQEERLASGETDKLYKMVGPDSPEAPLERPLRERLRKAMADRKLAGPKVAELFGVTKMSVSRWLSTEVGKGKPIAEALVPLVERWIATGEAPTADELGAIRKPGRRVSEETETSAE